MTSFARNLFVLIGIETNLLAVRPLLPTDDPRGSVVAQASWGMASMDTGHRLIRRGIFYLGREYA